MQSFNKESLSVLNCDFSSKEELESLITGLENFGLNSLAAQIKEKFYDVLSEDKKYTLELSQSEIDLLHIVLGFVVGKNAASILSKIQESVSSEFYEKFERMELELSLKDQESDFSLRVNGLE